MTTPTITLHMIQQTRETETNTYGAFSRVINDSDIHTKAEILEHLCECVEQKVEFGYTLKFQDSHNALLDSPEGLSVAYMIKEQA